MKKQKALGFALGSGGARGVAHIGFLQAMEEEGIVPDYISGCSMGSVVGMAYAAGMSPKEMREAAFSLKMIDLIDLTNKPGGLFDTRKIRKLLTKYVGEIEFKDLKIPYRCVAVDLHSQEVVEMSEGDVIGAVIASSSIPGVFKPTERDGMRLIDGGVLERVPVKAVRHMGAKQIVAVDVLGQKQCRHKCPNAMGMLLDVFDIMDNHRTKRCKNDHHNHIDIWLEPDLGMMSQYSLKGVKTAYEKGYEIGKEHAKEIRKLYR
ncbi:MAG: patatin-like phospholipase family protein [Clostridia bacterium]|nr:patatin-like phospholipase family protein [Clostridia bacterium]